MTWLVYDPKCLDHTMPAGHPEKPARAATCWKRLEESKLTERCQRLPYQPVEPKTLRSIHAAEQIELAEKTCQAGGGYLDGDTPVCPASFDIARLAAGGGAAAVDAVLAGPDKTAFCLVRPPGHHATPTKSMGFCTFNNIALAARHAVANKGLARVLVVDWDVHHGNGTQDIFYDDGQVGFLSMHRFPFYPGTGRADETGTGKGLGRTFNLPVTFGTTRDEIKRRFADILAKAADRMKPELVLISAGFDAHKDDPIGSLGLESEDFVDFGKLVLEVAKTHAQGRVVSLLEGGYNIGRLADCVELHVQQLLEAR